MKKKLFILFLSGLTTGILLNYFINLISKNKSSEIIQGIAYAPRTWKVWQDGMVQQKNLENYWGYKLSYPRDFEIRTGDQAHGTIIQPSRAMIAFPEDAFNNEDTNFSEAYISISYKDINESQCYTSINNQQRSMTNIYTLNAIPFKIETLSEAAAGNRYNSTIYRHYQDNICFEIVTTLHTTNIQNYEPGTVQEFNPQKSETIFNEILKTLEFTNKNPYTYKDTPKVY